MIFDVSRETVLGNLEQYIRSGCYPFCVKPAYFRELEDFWEPDRRELERSMAQKGMSCVALCYNNNVDAGRSGLNRRVHNGELLRRITMRYGQNSTAFMKDVGLDKGNSLTAVMYGTTYNPAIRDMGKMRPVIACGAKRMFWCYMPLLCRRCRLCITFIMKPLMPCSVSLNWGSARTRLSLCWRNGCGMRMGLSNRRPGRLLREKSVMLTILARPMRSFSGQR